MSGAFVGGPGLKPLNHSAGVHGPEGPYCSPGSRGARRTFAGANVEAWAADVAGQSLKLMVKEFLLSKELMVLVPDFLPLLSAQIS